MATTTPTTTKTKTTKFTPLEFQSASECIPPETKIVLTMFFAFPPELVAIPRFSSVREVKEERSQLSNPFLGTRFETFLDAFMHLRQLSPLVVFSRVLRDSICHYVCLSVCRSVGLSVCRSVTTQFVIEFLIVFDRFCCEILFGQFFFGKIFLSFLSFLSFFCHFVIFWLYCPCPATRD